MRGRLRTGGITKRGNPRKFYKFGLLDPFDAPHATFRFYCRTVGKYRTKQELPEMEACSTYWVIVIGHKLTVCAKMNLKH